MAVFAVLGFIAALPFFSFLLAVLRSLVLFWPTMITFGMLHAEVPQVPAFGWWATFLILMVVSLVVPTSTGIDND